MLHSNRIAVHTSDRKMFKRCRRKYQLASNIERGLQPKKPNSTLWLGLGVHHALEHWYASNCSADLVELFTSWAKEEKARLLKDPQVIEVDEAAVELGTAMLSHYQDHWQKHDSENYRTYKTEVMFSVPITNPDTGSKIMVTHPETGEEIPATYDGRIDGIVIDKNDDYWILEHKTAKSFSDWPDKLPMDEQITSYIWAAETILDVPIKGVIYNGLYKAAPSIPPLLKNGTLSKNKQIRTTGKVYRAEIEKHGLDVDDYGDFLQMLDLKGNPFFKREYVMRSREEILMQQAQIFFEAKEMLGVENYYPNPTRDCSWDCDFKEVCSIMQAKGDPEPYIDMMYEKRPHEEDEFEERIG